MNVILDASILVETLDTTSADAEIAAALRTRLAEETLHAPAVIVWEVSNYVTRRPWGSKDEEPQDGARAVAALIEDIRLEIPSQSVIATVLELASKHTLTFYDASYLDLAVRTQDSILVTQDTALRKAAILELGEHRALTLRSAHERFAPSSSPA